MRWRPIRALLALITVAAGTPGYHVVHGWPELPRGFVFGGVSGVGVNTHGEVYVFHRAGRVWTEPLPTTPLTDVTLTVLDATSGRVLRRWGAGLFAMPHGLTIDAHDNVWLTDIALQQVFEFSRDGKLLLTVGERGIAGSDARHFDRPTDVAVLPDGSFLVSDGYRNTRVARFSATGKYLGEWGGKGDAPGRFATPHAVVADAGGRIYVADRNNARVQVFDRAGRFVTQWRNLTPRRPFGLALTAAGGIVVVGNGGPTDNSPDDSGGAVYDAQGQVRARFGGFGRYDGQFVVAHDVAVGRDGAIYVVDGGGDRIQKFVPD